MRRIIVGLCFSLFAIAAVPKGTIPRIPSEHYVSQFLWEGGEDQKANLENMRVAMHGGAERWVIDFSDVKNRRVASVMPRFQLETQPTGRLLVHLRAIQAVNLTPANIQRLVKKSRYVKNVILYPQVDGGDMVIEFQGKDKLFLSPHQPTQNQGRLVLDFRKNR